MDGDAFRDWSPAAPHPIQRELLRFLTCGSVDDGKSTLVGRLLFETGQVAEDQLRTLGHDSRRFGTTGGEADYALLLDGLEAEREQGITIDVAYRYFSTPRRSFIVADTPGHEQYTRNMATGASTCDLAVILVDASKGLTAQTERHSRIVALFGIRQVILAVNKIDRIDGDESSFRLIEAAYAAFAADLGFRSVTTIPLSARHGDNLVTRSEQTPWYDGPTLLEALETADVTGAAAQRPFRFPVQYVNRPGPDFRGYAGTVASGVVRPGDAVVVGASGQAATVARIVTWDGDRPSASAGDAVTLVLDRELDIARGDVLAPPDQRPAQADRFEARLLWMDERPLVPGRGYLLRMGTALTPVRLAPVETGEVAMNGIADCVLTTTSSVAFAAFADDPVLGAFVVIDRETDATVAAGVATKLVCQSADIHLSPSAVTPAERERLNGHRGGVVWLTGLSGSGKSTIVAALERRLFALGVRTTVLDGDNLRHGLNRDLSFSDADRAENVRRTGEVARLFADAGVVALCALISPFEAQRAAVRDRIGERLWLEVFVDAPLDVCRARDPKGLYARADSGALSGLTGIDAPYERPVAPDLIIESPSDTAEAAADRVVAAMQGNGFL